MSPHRWLWLSVLLVLVAAAAPATAQARPAASAKDGRPNILVVMTDDQSAADLAKMPNVRRLLAAKGTTFENAVDSFPLCCPARATFITGQYAHNHGVLANFYPFGWYGMKNRRNTLPAWLQRSGYRTGLVGKWLNGYGAKDAHGEVPHGFDIWRGLLDASAYDYFNFVMNRNGKLKTWGDSDFARKLVKFSKVEVIDVPDGLPGLLVALRKQFGPPPYRYWGTSKAKDYSPDVTGAETARLVKAERRSKKPFFIWWAPAASHREDVATTLMGRPGPDPRPAPRYAKKVSRLKLPRGANFNEADLADKPANMRNGAPQLTAQEIEELESNYQGRIGSLLAVDDHVKKLVATLKRTGQLKNTTIVFLSDNGWMQGEHRIPGDKFLPYEESLRIPLIVRGPGVPAGRKVQRQVSNIDFAPTLLDMANARAGRKPDGVSLLPTLRGGRKPPARVLQIEAPRPLFSHPVPVHRWARPYKGVRTDRFTYVVYTEAGDKELYDRRTDPAQMRNVAGQPAYAQVQAQLARDLAKLERCRGSACNVRPQ